ELSLKDLEAKTQGPTRTVVIREPDSGRFQPLPEVQGKRKEKVIEEQAARDLLTLQTPKKQSTANQFIFQRHSEKESDKEVTHVNKDKDASNRELTEINAGVQDEGRAGSNPGNAAVFQPQPSHVVHVVPNLEPMDLAVSDSSTQQNPEQLDEEFTTTAYPNVQENLKLPTEDQVILEESASSTRTMSSLQHLEKELSFTDQFFDTSSVPPMTTPVIDLTTSQADSPTVHAPLPTSTAITTTITTTTTLPPPPLQP
ncbi:hypothetical protein Tco_1436742, partial [Tanacetum coccineum]